MANDTPQPSAIVLAARKYMDPETPQEEKNRLRHKLDPWIRIENGVEVLDVPGLNDE